MGTKYMDELAGRALWLMNEIITEREQFDSFVKNGFIRMAQSRYVLGTTAVSSLKFPASMSASYVVESEMRGIKENLNLEKLDDAGTDDEDGEGKSVVFRSLVAAVVSDDENSDTIERVATDGAGDADAASGLRQRCNVDKPGDSDEPDRAGSKNDSPKEDRDGLVKFDAKRDPLKWFGVLVPSTLRQSQADFRRAVESSVRLVNYQEELMKIVVEYRKANARSSEE